MILNKKYISVIIMLICSVLFCACRKEEKPEESFPKSIEEIISEEKTKSLEKETAEQLFILREA